MSGDFEIDWSVLMEQFDGDRAVVCEIVEAYISETRETLEQLPAALASGSAPEVRRQAHTLCGTMRMFGATSAEQTARRLERTAAAGTLEGADEILSAVLADARRLLPELERFVAGPEPPRA